MMMMMMILEPVNGAEVFLMCSDESNDTVMTNGRSETANHVGVATCGNGGISNNIVTSDQCTLDPEVSS